MEPRAFYDEALFRVWPDGTVQCADEEPYPWMSDDYRLVWGYDEDAALAKVQAQERKLP